jgi:POT family proton-dependent oligopeptide transporter
MKAVLMLFMTEQLATRSGQPDLMSTEEATTWIHTFGSAVYFTPLLGALLADLFWGKYRTIILLSIVYCAGHLVLALDTTRSGLLLGLALIAAGAGGIKPCVSAHVGDQFGSKNAHLLPKIYNWFYFSINLGSFLSMIITPWLRVHYGPHWAFAVPGILMGVATLAFWMGRRGYAHLPPQRKEFLRELASPQFLRSLPWLGLVYCFVAVFWALFDQTHSRWVEQAKRMDCTLLGLEIQPEMMQSFNALLILIFIPLFSTVVYPALEKIAPMTPLRRISIGLFLASTSFVVPALVEHWMTLGARPSIAWQGLAYVLITAAEIMISITCLEFSYTQAPRRLKSFVMGLYLLSVTLGNVFVALVNLAIQSPDGTILLSGAAYYWFFVACMTVAAVGFVFVARGYKGQTYIQEDRGV